MGTLHHLFQAIGDSIKEQNWIFEDVTSMKAWLARNPGYTGKLQILIPTMDGVKTLEYMAENYDAADSSTFRRLTEHPVHFADNQ